MTRSKTMMARTALVIGALATFAAGPADARRGGSFGSRGARTYAAPRSTRLAPGETPAIERSMTSRSPYGSTASSPSYAPSPYQTGGQRRFGGFGGGLVGGLLAGGLIGGLLGHGFGGGGFGGGGGGGLALLIQIALIGGAIWLALRFFRSRRDAAEPRYRADPAPSYAPPAGYQAQSGAAVPTGDDIVLAPSDQDAFERLLIELQDAFGREDYARLRAITTPEIMSYLAEELSDNATHGRRNEVSATRLLDGEVSEAWREGDADYATIAMRYEGIDVMRDRASGALLSGDERRPTETTELWTFVRPAGAREWKVSAIQQA